MSGKHEVDLDTNIWKVRVHFFDLSTLFLVDFIGIFYYMQTQRLTLTMHETEAIFEDTIKSLPLSLTVTVCVCILIINLSVSHCDYD